LAYLILPEGTSSDKNVILPTTVVVQHSKTRQIIWSMTLGEMASSLFDYDILSKTAAPIQAKMLKELGRVQLLEFFDPSTLYWSGFTGSAKAQKSRTRWSYLFVQFANRIVLVNLRKRTITISARVPAPQTNNLSNKPLLAHITQESLKSMISSNAVPISHHILLVGTIDGLLKVYDWNKNILVCQMEKPLLKNDCFVYIYAANTYANWQPSLPAGSTIKKRVVALTKKGQAYLIELIMDGDTVKEVMPPTARFEGGSVPASMSKSDDDNSSMEHVFCQYDAFRNILLWCYPSKSKSKLFVWDLSKIPEADTKQLRKGEPAKPDPVLVMQFPYETTHTILPGWMHESVPLDSITCLAVTKEGGFQMLVAPLNNASTIKNPFMGVIVFSVNLGQVLQRDLQMDDEKPIRVQSINCVALRDSSIFYFGTSVGILLVRMVDGNLIPIPGAHHAHLSANVGSLGKSILSVKHSEIMYGALESNYEANAINPVGHMESKNSMVVYESPPPLHLPPEIHKRPVRLPPCFLPSPSNNYLCCFWKEEMRYEVLHVPTMLQRVTSRNETGQKTPVAASGNGVSSFAWVEDDDVFCLLYNPEQDLALKAGIDLSPPTPSTDLSKLKDLASLNTVASAGKMMVGTAAKLKSLEGLREIANTAKKTTIGSVKGTVNFTSKIAVKGTTVAMGGANRIVNANKVAIGGGMKLSIGGKRRQTQAEAKADGEDDQMQLASDGLDSKHPWVELRVLVSTNTNASDVGGNILATVSNLGRLTLRSGKRQPPTILFGGPVLCVASKLDENDEGVAYFYTRKKGENDTRADEYVSSGPAFPCPDLVAWDDDGRLCAVVIQSRVAIYLSDEPDFVLLGTAKLGSSSDADVQVVSVRFIHGVLYCTTRSSVQCVFLGDLEGGICHLDSFTLASSDVPTLPSESLVTDYNSLTPPTLPMPLSHPVILGYHNGSLIVSTATGVQAIPLKHPLLRIGSLIAAGHHQKAECWFEAVPESDHEALASFLDRRGVPELALLLTGLSLETTVDLCMRYGFTDRLEEVVDLFGLQGLRAIDMGRGVSSNIFGPDEHGTSVLVCVGAYLLSQGKVELVRRLATECLGVGEDGKRDGFILASLLLSVDGSDSKRVIQRAVQDVGDSSDWMVGNFVRDHILPGRKE
jgi:hypothetical protein